MLYLSHKNKKRTNKATRQHEKNKQGNMPTREERTRQRANKRRMNKATCQHEKNNSTQTL
jgi:hypothetical protein